MSMPLIVAIGCTLVSFILLMGLGALLRARRDEADDRVKDRLREFAMSNTESESVDLVLKQSTMNAIPWFNRLVANLKITANIDRTIRQANAKGSASVYLLACAAMGALSFYGVFMLSGRLWAAAVVAWIFGSIPLFFLRRRKNKRMNRFQQQLPDALDLMARALKAGHTFAGAMRMVSDELEDPIAGEFRITLDEINFGMDVNRALENLQNRVDVSDLKFFVVSVNIQRETGGNLAEIISNISRLVRERFVLYGKVKILSAEGRLSALLLSALPFCVVAMLYFVNRDYMSQLWLTEIGRSMAWGSGISMLVGITVMRRMVKIKV